MDIKGFLLRKSVWAETGAVLGKTLIFDREERLAGADAAGSAVWGLNPQPPE
jgi:hypothetical protein